MEFIRSNKGKLKLLYNGFAYTEQSKSSNGQKIYWKCVERSKCNSTMHTTNDGENSEIIKDGTEKHINQVEDHRGIAVKRIMGGVKRHAAEHPNEPSQQILRRTLGGIADREVRDRQPQRNSMRRLVNLHQNRARPRNPDLLSDTIFDATYTTTERGNRFLLDDSGEDDPDRVVVFCSEEGHRRLCESEIIFADGTFKTVPNQFAQLYTIHGIVRDTAKKNVFPFVYCLCVRKDERTYRTIWQALTDEAQRRHRRFQTRFFMADFEFAALNAFAEYFPHVQRKACLFRLSQSLWRQVVNLGLRTLYVNADDEPHTVRVDIRRLMALPLVPLPDIEQVFDLVVENMDDRVVPLVTYIENNYLRGHRPLRTRRGVPPRFPPTMWSMHETALSPDFYRTNNVAEAYHSKSQKLIVVHHANIWRFLDEVKEEEHDTHQLCGQIRAGHINMKPPPSKKYSTSLKAIHRLLRSYQGYKDRGNILEYLEAVSYHIRIQPDN